MTTKEQKEQEARVLAYLQSIAMQAVALQQYVGEIAKFPHEVSTLSETDMDMGALYDWVSEEGDE